MTAATTRFGTATLAALLDSPSVGSVTIVEGTGAECRLSYDELAASARARLTRWRAAGAAPGERVILLFEERVAFLESLHAAWLGALVPVPVESGTSDEHLNKVFAIAGALGTPWLATESMMLERLEAFASARLLEGAFADLAARTLPGAETSVELSSVAATVADAEHSAASTVPTAPEPDDVALIQFSSGSTGAPKGVVLTHANLLANVDGILTAMAVRSDDVMLSWMPLTHDMGLIGFHLVPRLAGNDQVLMSTGLFVRRPGLWLERASSHRASVLCSPNFGYEHSLKRRRPGSGGTLDLSAVRLVFNGAEPISAELAARFIDTFVPVGLAPGAMFPVYGLAEASLAVTFPPAGAPLEVRRVARDSLGIGQPMRDLDRSPAADGDIESCSGGAVTLVGVGTPIPHMEVRIADHDGEALAPGHVGRILIRGPNVTAGYLVGGETLDNSAIDARGWLDTGDLGAFEASADGVGDGGHGPLFVTGRVKDIVFAGGRNLYPADLERTLVEAGAAIAGKVVVAAVPTEDAGRDLLAVFVQHRAGDETFAEVSAAVRATLSGSAGVRCDLVVPVSRVPKTTSGKVQRFRLVEALLADELELAPGALEVALASAKSSLDGAEGDDSATGESGADGGAPSGREAIELYLLGVCRTLVENGSLSADDNLFELGVSSPTLAAIHAEIESTWPGVLDITDMFDHPSVAKIAEALASRERAE